MFDINVDQNVANIWDNNNALERTNSWACLKIVLFADIVLKAVICFLNIILNIKYIFFSFNNKVTLLYLI